MVNGRERERTARSGPVPGEGRMAKEIQRAKRTGTGPAARSTKKWPRPDVFEGESLLFERIEGDEARQAKKSWPYSGRTRRPGVALKKCSNSVPGRRAFNMQPQLAGPPGPGAPW